MSGDRYGVEMSTDEAASFLARRGHGVLSFGGAEPYGIPVSFGFDEPANRLVFQLVFFPDSEKRARIEASDRGSLVAYEWNDPDDWWSVVVRGTLHAVDPDEEAIADAAGVFAAHASVVGLSVFNRPAEDLDPEWYALDVETMTGYRAPAIE